MMFSTNLLNFKLQSTNSNSWDRYQLPSTSKPSHSRSEEFTFRASDIDFKLTQPKSTYLYEFPATLGYSDAIKNGLSHPFSALIEAVSHPIDSIAKPMWNLFHDVQVLNAGCGYVSFGSHSGLVKWKSPPQNEFNKHAILQAQINMDKRISLLNSWINDITYTIQHGSGPKRVELGVGLATQITLDLLTEGVLVRSRLGTKLHVNKMSESLLPTLELFGNIKERSRHNDNEYSLFSPTFKLEYKEDSLNFSSGIPVKLNTTLLDEPQKITYDSLGTPLPDFKLTYTPDETFNVGNSTDHKSVLSQGVESNSTAGMYASLNIPTTQVQELLPQPNSLISVNDKVSDIQPYNWEGTPGVDEPLCPRYIDETDQKIFDNLRGRSSDIITERDDNRRILETYYKACGRGTI